jgi:hypothetical protein
MPSGETVENEFRSDSARARVEINTAYRLIEEAFSLAPPTWRPSRLSLKPDEAGPLIELAFITPQIGRQQHLTLDALAAATGWRLRIKPEPNLNALIEAAMKLIPAAWGLRKQPGIHKESSVVRIKASAAPASDDPQLIEVCERFQELTGYRLEVTP